MEAVDKKFSRHFQSQGILSKYDIHKYIILIIFLLFIVYVGTVDYIVSHAMIETLNTAICFSFVIIVINSYETSRNKYFLFLGIVFGFVSFFNFLHVMTYMSSMYNGKELINISAQLNIAFRLVEALSILTSFIFLYKNFNKYLVLYFYTFLSLFLLHIIFSTNYFPTCFIAGYGKTTFYVISGYIVILCMVLSTILFIKNKSYFSKKTAVYLSIYLISSIVVRYMFIINDSVYHDADILVHILKFISFYFLYKALVENIIRKPLKAIFNDLNSKNIELEFKTMELEKAIASLNEERAKVEEINEKLNISKNNYKALIEFLPDAVILRHNYKITYVNTAAIKLFGAKSKKELIGKTPFELFPKHHLDDLTKKLKDQKDGINPIINFGEYEIIDFDGKIKDVEIKCIPLEPKENNLNLGVMYHISERKRAEKAVKLLNEAKESEKLKTEFFANLSHELRTPINVIYSALQVVESNSKDEFTKKYNSIIKQNCYRLLRLVNNIIDSTKIEEGFLSLNLTCNNIVSVVEDIAQSVAGYIELHNMTLIFDTDVEEKYLNFDLDAIERIILNLISNAIKFRREDSTINIDIYDKGNSVIISVKDNGIGISNEQQRFVFEKFRQADKSFTRNTEGSGIGLSLVKSLVELHKGTITLKSIEGLGSEFIIELPISETTQCCVENSNENFQSNMIEKINIEFSDIYVY
jgi:PAS domain S-box-containing protein